MPTDFERYGLAERPLEVRDRSWLLTVDFEAFDLDQIGQWINAMRHWERLASDRGWRFSFFLSIEDVVRLRAAQPTAYQEFLTVIRSLHRGGSLFYPHNHGVFDEATGNLAKDRPERIPGYPKRASMFYDVVVRHGRDFREWLSRVVSHYDGFLRDAGLQRPRRLAFRAGGWDCGATERDARTYVNALTAEGFAFDSSASRGTFGTRTWRIGAPFGHNAYQLTQTLAEVAPCSSLDCGKDSLSLRSLRSILELARQPRLLSPRRRPGALVTVIHFDNLFGFDRNEVATSRLVADRIDRFFRKLVVIRRALSVTPSTFEDIVFTS